VTDDDATTVDQPDTTTAGKSWPSRHPKFMILLTAAIFYVILFGMCGFVLILLLRG
jgi:hypothetical protein